MWLRTFLVVFGALQGVLVVADDEVVTAELVQARLEEVEKSATLTDETKATIRDLYQMTQDELKTAADETARAEAFAEIARTAPEDLGRARRELSLVPDEPDVGATDEESLERLQQRLADRQAELAQQSAELDRLDDEPQRRATRRRDISKQRVDFRQQLDDLQRQLDAKPDPADPSELLLANRSHLLAKTQALQATLTAGTSELDAYQATIDLLPLQRDLAAARVAMLQREVAVLQSAFKRRQRGEVADQLQMAQAEVTKSADSKLLVAQAKVDLDLVERRKQLREQTEETADDLASVSKVAEKLGQDRRRIEEKVKTVGLTGPIGLLMRQQKARLPELNRVKRDVGQRQPALKAVQFSALQLEDRRADLADLDAEVGRVADQAEAGTGLRPASSELDQLRKLLSNERRYTDYLIADSHHYIERLLELDRAERELIAETEDFTRFIDENVLWVRSAETFSAAELPVAVEAVRQIAGHRQLQDITASLAADVQSRLFTYLLVLAAIILARVVGWRMTVQYKRPQPKDERPTRFGRLLRDILRVVLCAAPLPALMWFVGQRLSGFASETGFTQAVGVGLASVAINLLPLALLFRICRRRGFARRHLGWSDKGIRAIRAMLFVLILAALPLMFVHTALNAQDNVLWQDSLGRICFVVNVLIVALFAERFLRPRTGVLYRTLRPADGDILSRLRWLWYLVGVGMHIALAIIAIVGYTYAADRLGELVRATALLLACLLLIGSLLVHWTHVNSRRRAIRRLAQMRAAETAQAAAKAAAEQAVDSEVPPVDTGDGWVVEPESSGNKMRSLVTTMLVLAGVVGCWIIWVDVIPAFNVVNKIKIWDTEVAVSQTVPDADGEAETATVRQVPKLVPVTLGDVLLAIFVVVGTIIAARYIAGLFELPILDRMPLDSALENTITTVTRYVLWIVAVVVAAGLLGISWGKVQWMAAALSVGLGFGLQEIFANFISGLIILFERPMRVGDVITIGDTTGVVQGIRMRATTITDWDRKELVVPNKEFATGRLLNWTLTNKTNRRVIEVAVEYGTDPDLVKELLLKVAKENSRVLDTPKPIALFQQFGESALLFSLRVYHGKISDRLRGLHELNTAIQRELKAAGVRFAFPQRDLHIRTPQPTMSWFGPEEERDSEREGGDAQS